MNLIDVAPTILNLLDEKMPSYMIGNLIDFS